MFKTNTNSKIILLFFFILINSTVLFAQNNFFKTAENSQLSKKKEVLSNINKKRVYSLDEKAMRSYLRKAPIEFKNNGATIPLDIPLPDGTVETFNMVESPLLSAEVAAANPSIKTYIGTGTKDKKASISLSLTSAGFNAIILNIGNETVYFDSYSKEKTNIYYNYFIKDVVAPSGEKSKSCLVDSEKDDDHAEDDQHKKKESSHSTSTNKTSSSSGTQLRTFRLAIVTNGEFTTQFGSGTAAGGLAAVVAYVSRIRLIVRKELAVDFSLVSGENLIYTNPTTDPFAASPTLNSIQTTINTVLGSGNVATGTGRYDIGHLLGAVSGSGNGLAGSRVCESSSKGRAYSLIGTSGSYGLDFMDNLILHEMGHQFGMNHSFNSTASVCTTRNAATSVEPGAGTTIMSYGYICGTDNYPEGPVAGTLLQYHSVNYKEAINFLETISCQVTTATNNVPPIVTVTPSYTIPKSTPFVLTGSATDANNDSLTYCWEGTNIGAIEPDATTIDDTTKPPFFRTYPATTSPSRTYPALASILDGTNQAKGDKLPSISTITTHTLTVRDNNAAGGGVTNAAVTVTVDENIGPFLITSNTYPVINALSSVEVTWSVNGTNVATPTVNILFSIDGGLTFPRVLASGVPNDGSQFVTIPTIPNTVDTARFKVEAVGNIFFDISNTNIVIRQPMSVTFSGINVTPAGGATGSVTATVTGGRNTYNFSTVTNFTNGPYSIVNTLTTYSTINVPALPAGSILNASTLTFVTFRANSPSWRFDVLASLTGTYNLSDTRTTSTRQTGLASTNPSIDLPNFPLSGATISLRMFDDYDDVVGADATIASANITLNYTRNGYTYLWSNGATTPTISSLVAGVYSVTVTDAFGNTTTGSYTVSNDYSITATSGANGTVTPAGVSTVARNGSMTYNFTPNSCFRVSNVLVNGTSVGAVSSYTFSNVTTNQTIAVSFVSNTSNNTTTVTACDSYVWNGTTYTATGIYTGTTTNCVTQRLDLTITPSWDNVTTISACNFYTWANNNQTYTTSGVYTGTTTDCINEKLYLTITPSSENVNTISACDSYTWWDNNHSYTTSGVYTGTTTNCITEKLNLTITPSLENITTISACDSYTWAENNQTYTTSGVYWGITANCVTEKLDLTITPNSTITTTVTEFASYTWADNGQTYTTSGVKTGTTTNCVTQLLNLTIIASEIPTAPLLFCAGARVSTAVGNTSLKFYAALSGGTVLASTTALTSKTFFVTEMVNGIESTPRVPITVVVNSLPATPLSISAVDSRNICKYIGTDNPVTFTAAGGTAFNWTVPTGASILSGAGTSTITVSFRGASPIRGVIGAVTARAVNTSGCISAARSLTLTTTAPATPGSLIMSNSGILNGAAVTRVGSYIGTNTVFQLTIPAAVSANHYRWDLPAGVQQLSGGTSNTITIDFSNVASGVGLLPIRVYAVAGCGESIARTLTLTKALPTTPIKLVLTDGVTTLTRASAYTAKATPLTLTATPSATQGATASSYSWVFPIGVNVVAGATEVADNGTTKTYAGTENVLTINFGGIAPGILTIPMGVYAVNGTGTSATARTLTLTSAAPATPGAITLIGFNNCNNSFTAQVATVPGVDYTWTVSAGTIIGGQGTNAIVINPETATTITINVVGSNGTGTSAARILLTKKSTIPCAIARNEVVATEFTVSAYPNPSSADFTIESSRNEANVQVYDMAGRLIENGKITAHVLQIGKTFSAGVYNVIVSQGTEVKTLKVIKK